MSRYNTLLLDRSAWDLVLDTSGNIAMAKPAYALAQDVASAVKTFLGEVYYDSTLGIPYFADVLGQLPPRAFIAALVKKAALTVPGVVTVKVTIQTFTARVLSGKIEFIDSEGVANGVQF